MSLNLIHLPKIIEFLYRLLKFLATVPFANNLILSNKYEYDYEVLDPLAMTYIPSSLIPGLPAFPKADELPNEKWFALVLSTITLLVNQKTTDDVVNESVPQEKEIEDLGLINDKIKEAEGQEALTNAVMKLKKALGLADTDGQSELDSKTKNDIQLESNSSDYEDEFDKIDREIQAYLSQITQLESATPKAEEVEPINQELYGHLQEIAKSLGRELIKNQPDSTVRLESPSPVPTLPEYEQLINPLKIKPATLTNFQKDDVFAYMQVAGPNPVMLNQIKKIDSRLPITNEQYQKIVHQDSLEAALQERRIYLADYKKLETLENGSFGEFQKYIYAPVALFVVPPDGYLNRNLLPIAIRCQQTPGDDNPIFTPLDGENWMTAKTVLQMADSNYHELFSHLAQTHLFIEPFVLATNRCFDKSHAVRLLLKPHLEGTVLINYGAHKFLLAPEGPIDSLLSGTIDSNCNLAIKEALSNLANFNEVAFPKTLEKRGVNNSQQLPIYPYRDDGKLIWDAIHQWVKNYLGLFYASDNFVEKDIQLQKWASELLNKGKCHIGDKGDGQIKTLDYLVEAISTVIFTASAQHAAVNFPQSGLMTYAPAFPLGCYSPAPKKTQQQQDFMGLLSPLERAELQIQVLYLLGSVYYTKLGDYSSSFLQSFPKKEDKEKVEKALNKFKVNLNDIETKILNEDSQRLVSYRYLLPNNIPQSINI
ncbi:lipoxygenase family protein [Nostoc parmelioides]|uniref:Lipoxygenase n=1 Tax=Nostoc parmelioides FACHB-3921 TaxID=2692909 RepID=A0ABR8BKN2_9NOSO|nr:lipoxygenase family protein [Nostoc parmelioides]MBD2253316.1 lipoxygenase [Nostoc parmelioides FACHB-3921]